MKDKRVVFMGTPEFSVPVLEMLIEKTDVVLVVTQPDSLVGRKKELTFSPVKKTALKNNIEVFQPIKIKEDYNRIIETNPDIIITCAYGQIIPQELLDFPKYKAINVHASLLPKYRGGAPIHWAIINGEEKSGITIMYMAKGMDSGDIIKQNEIMITSTDNVGTMHNKLSLLGRSLLEEVLPTIFEGTNERIAQDPYLVSFAYNIKREDEIIDFNNSSKDIYNKVRGLYPFPIASSIIDGEIIKICECRIGKECKESKGEIGEIINIYFDGFAVKCLDKEIIITKVKPSGKKEMLGKDYINGKRNLLGRKLCSKTL